MEIKIFYARDNEGRPAYLPVVHIFELGTENYISGLEDEDGNSLTNPFTGTASGVISVGAPDGEYTMRVVSGGRTEERYVQFLDASANIALTETYKNQAAASVVSAAAHAAAAATSAAAATAIVVSGDVSYDPMANQVPLARSNGKIDPQWIQGAAATRNSVEAGTATTGLLIPDTTEYVFTPAMTRVFNVFIPETLTSEILVYTHGTDGIYITTERRIRLNCGGGFYESEVLPTSVLGDSLEIAISRADNEASTVTVFFVVNGVQFGATQVSAFSDLYIRSLLVGIDGFFLTVSPGTAATTNAGTTRVSNPAEAIGLLYDGGPNAEDFSQATGTARPLIGRQPVGGRLNLLASSDQYNTVWAPVRVLATEVFDQRHSDYPTMRFWNMRPTTDTGISSLSQNQGYSGTYTVKFLIKPNGGTVFGIAKISNSAGANFNFPALTVTADGGYTGTIEDAGEGFYWVSVRGDFTAGLYCSSKNKSSSVAGDGINGFIVGGSMISLATTPRYQRVTNSRDITEVGVGNTWYAFFDLSDDILTTTVPAITDGTIVIAGTNGIWIDTLTVSAGTFSIGATTHTGGPAGLLAVVGNVIGAFVINRALTAPEQAAIVAYYKAKGSPGVFELGAELVTNGTFDTDITGWTAGNGAVLAWNAGGYIDVTGDGASFGGNARQAVTLVVGQTYIGGVTCIAEGSDARIRIQTSTNPGTSVNTQESLNAGSVARRLFTATATTTYILLENNGTTGTPTFDVATIRAITLNTGA